MKNLIAVLTLVVMFTATSFDVLAQNTVARNGYITLKAAESADASPTRLTPVNTAGYAMSYQLDPVDRRFVKVRVVGSNGKTFNAAVTQEQLRVIIHEAQQNGGQCNVACRFSDNDQIPLAYEVEPISVRKGARLTSDDGEPIYHKVTSVL